MNDHRAAPLNPAAQRLLPWLAAAIALVGVAVTLWYAQRTQPPPAHPETPLFRALQEPRVMLADAFRSYDSEALISAQLGAAGLTVKREVLERTASERYPLRRMATFTVNGYQHLGSRGTLVLEFFNDRLLEADFRPDDPARYAAALRRHLPGLKGIGTGHAEWVEPPLRVWSSVELAKSKVGRTLGSEGMVLWQDLRLVAQRDDWDARFGHIPPPAPR
jgi:hypothetical protein